MKPFIYSGVILALILGGCSTAYKTGQTPDDVYYSPAQERTTSYAGADQSQSSGVAATPAQDGSNYVTYNDAGSNNYASSNAYDYGYSDPYYSPYYAGNYGMGWNSFYSPYSYSSFWYPSMSIGMGWGYPWLGMGSYYSPWSYYGGFGGYPYYSYWGGYYSGYYTGKYSNPRPANSYGPRVGMSSNANARGYVTGGTNTNNYVNGNAPVRVFNTGSTGTARPGVYNAPRRVFTPAPDERPVNVSNNNRSGGLLRVFRSDNNSAPQPVSRPVNTERPAPVREFQQPARTFESAPRTESAPASAPVRTFSPRSR